MAEDQLNLGEAPPVDPALLAEAKETVDFLTKTAKVFRTYPRENTISITAIDNLHRAFSTYLEKHDSLELFVNRHELLFQEKTVYSETDPRRSFALKLDRDGVRRLVFYKDVARDELVGLLEALTTEVDEESLDDDVVTLLWEKQLEHVKVFVLDDLATGEAGYDPGLAGGGDQKGTDEGSATESMGSRPSAAPAISTVNNAAPEQGGQPAMCVTAKEKMQPLTEEQTLILAQLAKAEETRNVSDDLEDILFDILQTETEIEVYTNAAKVLLELALMHIKEASLVPAADLIGHMRSLAAAGETRPEVREQLNAQVASLGEPTRVAAIVETLKMHENLNLSDLARLFSTLPPESAPGLCDLLEIERYDKVTRLALKDLVKNNPRLLVPKFLGAGTETGKKLLGILESLADADVVAELAGPLTAADDALKAASMKLLESVKCPASRELLTSFAVSTNPTLRRGGLRALGSFPAENAVLAPLRAEAQAKDFDERALDEKKMLFTALARIEGSHAVQFLSGIVAQRPWFEKESHAETRACAALALGELDDDNALHTLEQFASDKSEAVATAVRIALNKHSVAAAGR